MLPYKLYVRRIRKGRIITYEQGHPEANDSRARRWHVDDKVTYGEFSDTPEEGRRLATVVSCDRRKVYQRDFWGRDEEAVCDENGVPTNWPVAYHDSFYTIQFENGRTRRYVSSCQLKEATCSPSSGGSS
jgi:hypothetical protein